MSAGPEAPLRVVRPVPLPRQFAVAGAIHSLGVGLFVGFFALVALKLGADLANGGRGDANLPFALAWSAVVFGTASLALWALHYAILVAERSRTSYAIFADRVEVRRDGSPRPSRTIPLAGAVGLQSWTGPLLRPRGLAILTIVVEEPSGSAAPPRHVFHPLPNVPDPDEVAALIRSLIPAQQAA